MVVRAAQWALLNPPVPSFSDVPPSDPFYRYVETAYCRCAISGYSDRTFRPGGTATRGQVSKVVHKALLNYRTCP